MTEEMSMLKTATVLEEVLRQALKKAAEQDTEATAEEQRIQVHMAEMFTALQCTQLNGEAEGELDTETAQTSLMAETEEERLTSPFHH